MKPKTNSSKETKVEYHCWDSCNKCAGVNDYNVTSMLDNHVMLECETQCRDCGFKDYWAHGYFESGQERESRCKKYSF